ncbi:universal stress protein [Winogradskyella sp. 3972H.M.0a.05]|uniref:universal stress protein n=1 Tax=Winogradskyella sp. 3972H.M.0a.05 TaxID=2950277 RepID=UPI0033972AFB
MKKNKYKILVLSDLKSSTKSTIKSTVGLAKMIDADIELFYVKKPTEIVDQDNQLSAMRTINREHISTEKKIQNVIDTVSKEYDMKINSTFSFGNVKVEIENHINKSNPDIVVLGKRKSNPLKFSGDNVTDFVLKKYKGSILIASEKNTIEPNKELSLGLINNMQDVFKVDFAEELLGHAKTPLKSFNIVNSSFDKKKSESVSGNKTVEYVFEQNDNSLKNLSNYLQKNNINLVCLDRENSDNKSKAGKMSEVIKKLEVPVLLSKKQEVA